MALFEVEGWNIKADDVAVGGIPKNKKQKSKEKKAKRDEMSSRKRKHDEKEQEEDVEEKQESKESSRKAQKSESTKGKKMGGNEKKETTERKKPETRTEQSPLPITQNLTPLQQKMMAKLSGSRFRWINEQLYTVSSEDAFSLIQEQPSLFDEYHQGFRAQVQSWPENPVDVFVDQIKQRLSTRPVNAPGGMPGLPNKDVMIADMGCGEAQLALDVNNFTKEFNSAKKGKKKNRNGPQNSVNVKVHSFDLKQTNERITVADIKNVPLPDESCSVVIFCLALMGTNFLDFVEEAYRILAPRGELWVAEIKSRFAESSDNKVLRPEDVGSEFVEALKLCGFFHKKTDNSNKMFSRFEFFKPPKEILEERKAKLERRKKFIEQESEKEKLHQKRTEHPEGEWLLKPCIYKRR
ncbi:Piso0_002148 [Millerozyma farinosa CBS 7064]|uniref:Ribosomal RNA-processing protein 8 n=1 Tax=Pichia sorbitophila (strain ATCC MYA-4447 / BCRC 22081 / CBS 7064 / NBRC 10061 / NRRL Y-12695) TaxID=559304 RepID=G8YBU1_PICSO|nr:Piso0_002148 [Millerozyma farinosa CBS 7064]